MILFAIVVTNWLMVRLTGYAILGGDLFTVFFIVFLFLLGITLIRPLVRKVVWRVRNRLLVTYFLLGFLPFLLIVGVTAFTFYILIGTTVSYLGQSELNRSMDQLENVARLRAQEISEGKQRASADGLPAQAVIRVGNRTTPGDGPIAAIPAWSKPGYKGIIKADASLYFIAAHSESGTGARRVEVFAYIPFDDAFLATMAPGLAHVTLIRVRDVINDSNEADEVVFKPILDSSKFDNVPKSGSGVYGAHGAIPMDFRLLDTGRADPHFISLFAQPGPVVMRLLSPLGEIGAAAVVSVIVLSCLFLGVVLIAVIMSAQLTRSLTRTIHDIYTGTKKIETGDFSHRIPVRTKDQLSELATSFNSMTEHIERLIVEVKEKEKLESELEIARQVQSQLFPKGVPTLRTIELAGLCNPARVVSGDYYDFIPLDSRLTALVIGDISGKGISAALLMASIQSSLHAQLAMAAKGIVSTATLVGRLNRQLYENTPPEKYATFYCGIYDDQNGHLLYTNAGHLPPILLRRGKTSRLEPNGMVVGMFPDSPYEQNVVELQSGDLLTAFTDGITESEDAKGEQFGDERLTELLIRYADRPLDEILQIVTERVRDWAHDLDNQDDTTMLLARRL